MKPSARNLVSRVLTAMVGLPIVGLFVYLRDTRWLLVLVTAVCVAALVEFVGLSLRERPIVERAGVVVLGTALFQATYHWPDRAIFWGMIVFLALGLWMLPKALDLPGAGQRLFAAGFGLFYIGGLLPALPLLHRDHGPMWLVLALALTFANDTGAYFVGVAWGKHKLAPAISPGKTWEGAIGGLVASMGVVFIFRFFSLLNLSLLDCVLLGFPAAVLGPTGDLLESLCKRCAGAKDSGRLLPGHGGILDRIDALLFVGAYVYCYVSLFR
jgi:phosphatidate cytidylyltransferase